MAQRTTRAEIEKRIEWILGEKYGLASIGNGRWAIVRNATHETVGYYGTFSELADLLTGIAAGMDIQRRKDQESIIPPHDFKQYFK